MTRIVFVAFLVLVIGTLGSAFSMRAFRQMPMSGWSRLAAQKTTVKDVTTHVRKKRITVQDIYNAAIRLKNKVEAFETNLLTRLNRLEEASEEYEPRSHRVFPQ